MCSGARHLAGSVIPQSLKGLLSVIMSLFLLVLHLCLSAAQEDPSGGGGPPPDGEVEEKACAPGCKHVFLNDQSCDNECFNEQCGWDAPDCDDRWELKRMITMGPFHKHVDHVEYVLMGPNGEQRPLSMEEGRRWEGIDAASEDHEYDWRSMLDDDNKPESSTMEVKPDYELDEYGEIKVKPGEEKKGGGRQREKVEDGQAGGGWIGAAKRSKKEEARDL